MGWLALVVLWNFVVVPTQAATIISPHEAAQTYGGSGHSVEGPYIQQIHLNTEFLAAPSQYLLITGVAFRWDERTPSKSVVVPEINIYMGTFSKPLNQMHVVPGANHGRDFTQVLHAENVSLNSAPPKSPSDFEVRFTFEKPFAYDRAAGHLLMEHGAGDVPGAPIGYDVSTAESARYTYGGPIIFTGAIVTEFTYQVIPEPSTLALSALGLSAFLLRRRAHSQA